MYENSSGKKSKVEKSKKLQLAGQEEKNENVVEDK